MDNLAADRLVNIYRGSTGGQQSIQMTPEETERVKLVRERFIYMSQSKSVLDWKFTLEKQLYEVYEQHMTQGEIWNSPYRFPEIFGSIQRKYADLLDNMPEVKIRATSDRAADFAIATQATVDHTDRMTFTVREKSRALFDTLMYGTGILYEGYFRKTQKMTPVKGDDLLLDYKPTEEITLYDGLTSERVDPRDFFIDETAFVFYDETGIQGARDCIRRRSYPYSSFLETFKDSNVYKYVNNVQPIAWGSDPFGRGKIPFEKETQEQKTVQKYVVVIEYWNVVLDLLTLTANGIEIYCGANPFKHKRLPFTLYYNYRRDDSCWGVSEIEILAPFLYAEEELTNLMILDAKLALQPALAVSGDVMFNTEETELEPGAIFTLRGLNGGKVQDSIMPLRFAGVSSDTLQVRTIIEDKKIIATGDDIRALYSNPKQLATQTLSKRETAQKRIKSNVMQNTMESERNRVQMKISNIIQFYAKPYQNMDGDVHYRRIKIEGYIVHQDHDEAKPTFKPVYGANGYFTLNPESIGKGDDIEIEVIDSQLDEQLKRDAITQMMQYLSTVTQLLPMSPGLAQQMNILGLIKEIAKQMDVDFDDIFPMPETEEGQDAIDLELDLIMMGEVPPVDPMQDPLKSMERYMEFMQTKLYKNSKKKVKQAMQQLISLTAQNVTNYITQRLQTLRQSQSQPINGQNPMAGAGGIPGQGPEQSVPQLPGGALPTGGAPSAQPAAPSVSAPGGVAKRYGFPGAPTDQANS